MKHWLRELTTRVIRSRRPKEPCFEWIFDCVRREQVGPLVCSLVEDALSLLFQTRGRTWERLAFSKGQSLSLVTHSN